ncbi:MAG: hypothetical protein WD534_16915 [Phycisphaeraceae bacterium]
MLGEGDWKTGRGRMIRLPDAVHTGTGQTGARCMRHALSTHGDTAMSQGVTWARAAGVVGMVLFASVAWGGEAGDSTSVATVLRDYQREQPGDARPAVVQWNWTDEQKEQAASYGITQVVEAGEGRALKLTVTDQMPWGQRESYRVMPVGPTLLPPTADAVRLRYLVTEGRVILSCGGPTIYFGHSDVQTQPVTLTADAAGRWQTVELSLHDGLMRNFRRAGFGRESPVIYYTRWIQEPLYLHAHRGSVGTVLIDRVELLHTGRGQPYPTFDADAVQVIASIADFALSDAMGGVFTATHKGVDFSGEPQLARPTWTPPKLSHHVPDDGRGGALHIEHRGQEEVAFTGIKVAGAAEANAIAIDLRATHPADLDELSVDLIAYTAPQAGDDAFAWEQFAPPEAWRDQPESSFDYYLTQEATRDVSHAFYHARRALANGEQTRVIVPLADFVCVYGAGDMAGAMQRQRPINPSQVIAVGLLPSWRQRSAPAVFEISRIDWVRVPGEGASLRSFFQVTDVDAVKLTPRDDTTYGGVRQTGH